MTTTALTAEAEMRRMCAHAAARKESSVFADRREIPRFRVGEAHRAGRSQLALPVLLLEPSARRALAEVRACRDILTPAPARPTRVLRAWARLAALARRLGRLSGHAAVDRAVAATESPVTR